jgi:flavin-dependent dehydrogenase
MSVAPTFELEEAAHTRWDVVIVGAGPAGTLAAYELARWGLAVLLVDQAAFPRWKVCGCCCNGQALATLTVAGLGNLPARLGAIPLRQVVLGARGCRARIPLAGGVALSRQALDTGLVDAAIARGSAFLPRTRATLGRLGPTSRSVILHHAEGNTQVDARLVLAATGLGNKLFNESPGNMSVAEDYSWIGAGVIAETAPAYYGPHTIYMACGAGGYVGLVRLEDDRLDIAAALDPTLLKKSHHPGVAASQILRDAGFPPVPHLAGLSWRGTPPLTRHAARVALDRVFVLGDAAGYVEPFTGEGIAWALASARAVAPLAVRGAHRWQPSLMHEWTALYHRVITCRQRTCRVLTRVLRHPAWTNSVIRVLAHFPLLAQPVLRRLHQSARPHRGVLS